ERAGPGGGLGIRGLPARRPRAGHHAGRGPVRPARSGEARPGDHRGGIRRGAVVAELQLPGADRARSAGGPVPHLPAARILERGAVPHRAPGQSALSHHGGPADRTGLEPPRRVLMARSPLAGRDGFTLLEVLIAFAILSVAIVSLIQLTSQGLRLLKV